MASQLAEAARAERAAGILRTTAPANVHVNQGVDNTHEDPVLLSSFYNLAAAHPRDRFVETSGARYVQPLSGPYPIAPQGRSNHDPRATGTGMAEALDAIVNGRPIAEVYGPNELAVFALHASVPGDSVHLTPMTVLG